MFEFVSLTIINVKRRNFLLAAAAAGLGYLVGASFKRPTSPIKRPKGNQVSWKMITSWPAGAPGTGRTAERLAHRIRDLTQGQLTIRVYPAGTLVGALEVFDAVQRGTAELGHSASFFWQGKIPSAAYYTTVPFGLSPLAHHAWLRHGGGQDLWNRAYADFGLRAYAAGNTGSSMGGWFKQPLAEHADHPLRGLKIRMPGLAGRVMHRLGALPVTLPPGEIFEALRSGLVDAAELLGPWHDRAYGMQRAAKHYYYPGFHEPNGSAECLINQKALAALPKEWQVAIEAACQSENIISLSESTHFNAVALARLVKDDAVILHQYPDPLLRQLKEATDAVLADLAREGALARQIYASYRGAQELTASWRSVQL